MVTINLENLVSGKGCKKTVSWHTNCTKEEIDIKIKEFWDTRVEGNENVWNILKQACTEPDPSAVTTLLKRNNLSMPQGLLQQVYDERGHRYDLPPFVINPALKYGVTLSPIEVVPIETQDIRITFRTSKLNDLTLNVNTAEVVADLKCKLKNELNIDKKIKLFFSGKELSETSSIGNYSIKDQYIVQVFVID